MGKSPRAGLAKDSGPGIYSPKRRRNRVQNLDSMKLYELTYLILPDLADEELKAFSQKIDNFVQTEEGIVKKASSLMKRKLGYLIEKKEIVYSAALNFQLNPEKIENLEKKLKAEKSILRY
ncbi:unnamed protein product, partial [marine sediment metagenome]